MRPRGRRRRRLDREQASAFHIAVHNASGMNPARDEGRRMSDRRLTDTQHPGAEERQ